MSKSELEVALNHWQFNSPPRRNLGHAFYGGVEWLASRIVEKAKELKMTIYKDGIDYGNLKISELEQIINELIGENDINKYPHSNETIELKADKFKCFLCKKQIEGSFYFKGSPYENRFKSYYCKDCFEKVKDETQD